jgi:hypothetical protein
MSRPFLGGPPTRKTFSNLFIAATATLDVDALERLWDKNDREHGTESVTFRLGDAAGDGPIRKEQHSWRVWWMPPSCYRDELYRPGIPKDIAIVREHVRMMYLSHERTLYTSVPVPDGPWEFVPAPPGVIELPTLENRSAVFPLIRPPLPETAWRFETVAHREEYEGRVIRRVRVTRQEDEDTAGRRPHPGYMPLADTYECLVDDELQIVVRLTALAAGTSIAVVTADELLVDTPLPPGIFEFLPPPGARVIHVERSSE